MKPPVEPQRPVKPVKPKKTFKPAWKQFTMPTGSTLSEVIDALKAADPSAALDNVSIEVDYGDSYNGSQLELSWMTQPGAVNSYYEAELTNYKKAAKQYAEEMKVYNSSMKEYNSLRKQYLKSELAELEKLDA